MTTAQIILYLCGVLTVALGVYAYKRDFGARVEYDTDSILQDMAEYRTYVANQYVQLLMFWLGATEDQEAQVKLTTPAPNENIVSFIYDNLQIETHFNWPFDEMTVKASYQMDDEHVEFRKTFSMPGKCLDEGKLYKFICQVKADYLQMFEITSADVVELIRQIAAISDDAAPSSINKEYFYDKVAGLILALRRVKRLRNNSLVMQSFAGIIRYIWVNDKEGFLNYLGISKEEFLKSAKENKKN